MKKGFTMIELIFVIVILGILAAVAIPKLAATRDDAKIAAIQTDIGTFANAIPAWYTGQKDARIAQAVSIDTAQWKKIAAATATEGYALTLAGDTAICASIIIGEDNGTAQSDKPDINATTGAFTPSAAAANGVPVFRIVKGSSTDAICKDLWTRVTEQNITMGGKRVAW